MKTSPLPKESLLERYNCGPVKLSCDSNAFYERHVTFDQVVAETETSDRDKYEAIAARAAIRTQMILEEANWMNPSGAQTRLSKQGRKV